MTATQKRALAEFVSSANLPEGMSRKIAALVNTNRHAVRIISDEEYTSLTASRIWMNGYFVVPHAGSNYQIVAEAGRMWRI